jgi:hypothetical protein
LIRPLSGTLAVAVGFAFALVGACATPNLPPEDEVIDVPDRNEPITLGDAAKLDANRGDTFVPQDAGDAADGAATGPRVFVSSTTTKAGAINGLAGGDALCTSLATAAGLGGTWAAWLSNHDNGPHAIDRVTGAGPWRLVSGELVASSKVALASGTLLHAIDHDEKGVAVAAGRVWTGTGTDGKYSTNDCERWTPAGGNGRVGATDAVDATWTTVGVDDCQNPRRIYCFQL